ncbi:unnamed protein product [Spirodela intermedia]|uniref:Phytocyanin domain-containing protein n=1 Tax=Spirodela intermedia TaxID=51605 RepID=A0A7I8KK07_SPIIN|nr:unnamed protein product [Spirodela intermedia]
MEPKASQLSSTVAAVAVAVTVAAAMMGSSDAHEFYVGGRDGWVENPSESFDQWAGRNRFQVNDSLVFRYEMEDSVLVVTEADYRACNTSNPLWKLHGGHSVFRLTRSGPFFFISGAAGRCERGQKLVVVVLSVRGPRRGAAAPPPLAPAPPPLGFAPYGAPPPSMLQPPTAPPAFTAAGGPAEGEPPSPVSGCSAGATLSMAAVAMFGGVAAFLL